MAVIADLGQILGQNKYGTSTPMRERRPIESNLTRRPWLSDPELSSSGGEQTSEGVIRSPNVRGPREETLHLGMKSLDTITFLYPQCEVLHSIGVACSLLTIGLDNQISYGEAKGSESIMGGNFTQIV